MHSASFVFLEKLVYPIDKKVQIFSHCCICTNIYVYFNLKALCNFCNYVLTNLNTAITNDAKITILIAVFHRIT